MNISAILQEKYDRETWQQVLEYVFGKDLSLERFDREKQLTATEQKTALSLARTGSIANDALQMPIYEIQLAQNKDIKRNRTEVNDLIAKYLQKDGQQGALCVFYSPDKTEWRFSFVAKVEYYDGQGELQTQQTARKRYTYLFGTPDTHRTAQSRLEVLRSSKKDYDSIFNAFAVEPLSREFFKGYIQHYAKFCDEIYKQNIFASDETGKKQARDFVKKTLGRIVFLYFLQKKNWLNGEPNFVANFFHECPDKFNFYEEYLAILFFETLNKKRENNLIKFPNGKTYKIPYLNGGLFEKEFFFDTPIQIKQSLFVELFDFFAQYNFTIDEENTNEAEIAVNPEMLGHIFENLLEDNKEKGTFYTPASIVRYMCQESILAHLHAQGKQEANLPALIRQKEATGFTDKEKISLIKTIKALKICDPAIGSGAFPMGMLTEMVQIITALNPDENRYELKKHIIQHCIYGVDLEKGAVDIARLRFWLALVIDEEEPQPLPNLDYKIMQGNSLLESFEDIPLHFDKRKYTQKPIQRNTNLFGEIAAKEAQISLMEYIETQKTDFDFVQALQLYFSHKDGATKSALQKKIFEFETTFITDEIKQRIAEVEAIILSALKQLNSAVMIEKSKIKKTEKELENAHIKIDKYIQALQKAQGITPYEKPYFLWHLYFQEVFDKEGGFDIVIGNPPYGASLTVEEKEIFKKMYAEVHMRTPDTFNYFTALAFQKLVKEKGIVSYIVPNNLFFQSEYEKTRELLIKKNQPIKAINLGDGVFESATVPSCIFVVQKNEKPQHYDFDFADMRNFRTAKVDFNEYTAPQSIAQILKTPAFVLGVSGKDFEILERIEQLSYTIGELAGEGKDEGEVASGISTGADKVFRIHESLAYDLQLETELLHPVLVGGEIDKYSITDTKHKIIYTNRTLELSKYPNTFKYLEPFKEKLSTRSETKSGIMPWYALNRQRYPELFTKPKIIMRQTADSIRATYDESGFFVLDSIIVFQIAQKWQSQIDYKFILGMLNAKINQFAYRNFTQEEGRTFAQVKPKNVRKLFVPKISRSAQQPFIALVDYMLWLNAHETPQASPYIDNKRMTYAFENALNMCVYELYFGEEMKAQGIDVLQFAHFEDISQETDAKKIADIIGKAYHDLQASDNPIRNRIILAGVRNETITKINSIN